mgnify:CR=1 FL=1
MAQVYCLFNQQALENPSAPMDLLPSKIDYQDIYKEGPGTSVDPARLKNCKENRMRCPNGREQSGKAYNLFRDK